MFILITRHEKVFFNKVYLSNTCIELDVITSKISHFCLGSVCLDIFLKTFFFMYARPLPVQTKVHFENLQFLAVAYDIGFLSCACDVF